MEEETKPLIISSSASSDASLSDEMPLTIYTMPKDHLKPTSQSSSGSSKKFFLIIGFLIIAAVVYYIIQINPVSKTTTTTTNININATSTPTSTQSDIIPTLSQPVITPTPSSDVVRPTPTPVPTPTPTSTTSSDVASPTPTSTAPTSTTETPVPKNIPGQDSDKDNLTNIEEQLYGGNINLTDTDNDGYLDGLEIQNLYSITQGPSALLKDTTTIKVYKNLAHNYTLYYPANWTTNQEDLNGTITQFTSEQGENVKISTQENSKKLPLQDWYNSQSDKSAVMRPWNNKVLSGLVSEDGFQVYFSSPDLLKVYEFTYNFDPKKEFNFYSTYLMMLNSIKFIQ